MTHETDPDSDISYTFDPRGNRATMTANGEVTSYAYDLNNRLLDTAKTNADGSIGITAYTYDANGNRLSKLNETLTPIGSGAPTLGLDLNSGFELYEYDVFNRQRRANIGGIVTTYIYAASNLRHSKTTGGVMTTHVWDGSNISLDIVDGTATKYVRGIGLISSDDTFGVQQHLLMR